MSVENTFAGWEDADSSEDFFSQLEDKTVDETTAESVINKIASEQEEEEDDTKSKTKETSKQEDNLFEEEEESEEEEDNKGNEEVEEVKPGSSSATLLALKAKGYIDYELEEGEELTDELADEILEDKYEDTIEERIKDKLTSLPEDVQDFISFALKGGTMSQYLKEISIPGGSLSEDLDMETESNQELVIREIMAEEGDDEETIEAQIEFLKDNGKLENFAKKKFDKWKKEIESEKKEILRKQEEQRTKLKDQIREAKRKVTATLNESKNIGGITPSKDDVKTLPSYINDRTVKLQNGVEISEMQKELYYELPKSETAMIQLAILLKNRKEDGSFDFSKISKAVETQVTQQIQNKMRRKDDKAIPSNSSNRNTSGKSLADYFNN